jgi:hypothetical protein
LYLRNQKRQNSKKYQTKIQEKEKKKKEKSREVGTNYEMGPYIFCGHVSQDRKKDS